MKKEVPIFAIAADNWRRDVLVMSKHLTFLSRNGMLKFLIGEFGHKRVNEITKRDLQQFIARYRSKMGGATLRTYLSTLRDVIEYANDDWEMPRRLKYPKSASAKRPFYSFEEVRKLLQNSLGMWRTFIMLMAETGCRFGEAAALTSDDLDGGAIHITKNIVLGVVQSTPKTESSIRKINVSDTLMTELRSLSKNRGFLFMASSDIIIYPQILMIQLRKICKSAGIDYRPSHAFRRGNVRELILNLRIPERVVGMRIGHRSSESLLLGVYCQTQDDDDLAYVPQIEKWLYKGEK